MKIFLTGGTGYIGEKLAIALKLQYHEVYALVRSKEKGDKLSSYGINLIYGNLDDKQTLDEGTKDCDAVFHLAAFDSNRPKDEYLYKKINIEGTRNILDSAWKNQVKKVIFTSTADVFEPSVSDGMPIDEKTNRKVTSNNFYEASKAEAEEIVRDYARKGLYTVIVNPSCVYGPGSKNQSNAISDLPELFRRKKWRFIPGDGRHLGSYSYIDDIVDGHIKAFKYGRKGENYLLGGENVTFDYFLNLLKKQSKLNNKFYKKPVNFINLKSHLMVLWARFFRKNPLINPNGVKKYMYDWSISSKKAMDELGYTITPLHDGLKKTIGWLRTSNPNRKYTLITGSSSGIGKAMAEECAKRNQNLILVALSGTGLEQVSKDLQDVYQVDVKYFEINLTEEGAIQSLYNWCNDLELSINILINNAGIGNCSCFETTNLDVYLNMIQINSQAVVALTSIFIPKLREHEQSYILNMGSFASLMPLPFKSVYSATKSFVLAFSRALQMELKDLGISVSCVCPGPTRTESVMLRHELIGQKSNFLMMTPQQVAEIALDGLLKHKGLIIPGWKNRILLTFNNFVPMYFKNFLLKRIFKNGVEKESKIFSIQTPAYSDSVQKVQ
ncbi:hypothetical protein BH23BAC1_BH23BAC1_26580 [soil metagenome]